jgi:hypothetical protein
MRRGKEKVKENRTKWLTIRLTEKEYSILEERLKSTYCRKLSEYGRRILFGGTITVRLRNQSLDELMEELINLRKDLNALGNNFNQVVRKVNAVQRISELSMWLSIAEGFQKELLEKTAGIQSHISRLADVWLSAPVKKQKMGIGKDYPCFDD